MQGKMQDVHDLWLKREVSLKAFAFAHNAHELSALMSFSQLFSKRLGIDE